MLLASRRSLRPGFLWFKNLQWQWLAVVFVRLYLSNHTPTSVAPSSATLVSLSAFDSIYLPMIQSS
jgi:hypothetical protein